MSFMMFPPEVNSSLMYSGAGSGPLMAAASAWDELAADLEATAASYQTVLAQLTPAPTASDGGTSANAAAAAQSTANSASSTGTNLATALQNLFPSLSSNS